MRPPSPRLRDRRLFYGWKVVAAGAGINAVSSLNHYGFTVFFLPLSREMELSRASVSLLFSAAQLQSGVVRPVVGLLADRLGPRPVIMVGALLTGLGYLLMTQVHSFLTLFIVYFCLVSLGSSASSGNIVTAAVNAWFIRYKAMAMAIVDAASGLGGGIFVPILSLLIHRLGWRAAALFSGLVVWTVILPTALVIRRSPESVGMHPDGMPQAAPEGGRQREADGTVDFTVGQGVRTFTYWLLAASIALRMMVTTAITIHMVPVMVWKGLPETTAALLVSALALASIPTRLFCGWLGTRFSWEALSGTGALMGMASLLSLLVVPSYPGVYAFIILLTLTESTIFFNWALIGRFFGRKSFATLIGLMGPLHSVVTFATPIFAGWVYDRSESYTTALIVFCVLIGVSGLMFFLLRRPGTLQPKSLEQPQQLSQQDI